MGRAGGGSRLGPLAARKRREIAETTSNMQRTEQKRPLMSHEEKHYHFGVPFQNRMDRNISPLASSKRPWVFLFYVSYFPILPREFVKLVFPK